MRLTVRLEENGVMFKVLIVGLGQIGLGYDLKLDSTQYILTHARAFQLHPDFCLVAGVDTNPKYRQIFSEYYKVNAFANLEKALREAQPDVVVVAVPTSLHKDIIQTTLGLSAPTAILCEKPLSWGIEDARAIIGNCVAKNCQLYVNYIRRSDPGAIEIKRRLDQFLIQHPVKGVVWYSKGLFHTGSHFLNLLQYWLGEVLKTQIIQVGRQWENIDPEPDVQITFSRGAMTFLAAQEENFSHYTIELIAANGRLRYEQGGEIFFWQEAISSHLIDGYKVLSSFSEEAYAELNCSQWHVVEQLARSIKKLPAEICHGAEALKTLEVLSEIRGQL